MRLAWRSPRIILRWCVGCSALGIQLTAVHSLQDRGMLLLWMNGQLLFVNENEQLRLFRYNEYIIF